jgi:hypothetical protein
MALNLEEDSVGVVLFAEGHLGRQGLVSTQCSLPPLVTDDRRTAQP